MIGKSEKTHLASKFGDNAGGSATRWSTFGSASAVNLPPSGSGPQPEVIQ